MPDNNADGDIFGWLLLLSIYLSAAGLVFGIGMYSLERWRLVQLGHWMAALHVCYIHGRRRRRWGNEWMGIPEIGLLSISFRRKCCLCMNAQARRGDVDDCTRLVYCTYNLLIRTRTVVKDCSRLRCGGDTQSGGHHHSTSSSVCHHPHHQPETWMRR